MSLQNITSADLKAIAKLVQKKESLLAEVKKIESQLAGFQSGGKPAAKTGAKTKAAKRPARKGKKGTPRGAAKERILAALKDAGPKGMTVKAIAEKLGSTQNSVGVWFYTTGKKVKQIKKVAPSTYAYKG